MAPTVVRGSLQSGSSGWSLPSGSGSYIHLYTTVTKVSPLKEGVPVLMTADGQPEAESPEQEQVFGKNRPVMFGCNP